MPQRFSSAVARSSDECQIAADLLCATTLYKGSEAGLSSKGWA